VSDSQSKQIDWSKITSLDQEAERVYSIFYSRSQNITSLGATEIRESIGHWLLTVVKLTIYC